MSVLIVRVVTLLGAFGLLACNAEQDGTPILVARAWEIQIGGTGEPPSAVKVLHFRGVHEVTVVADTRYTRPPVHTGDSYMPPEDPELTIEGETRFRLPPSPPSFEAAKEVGVKVVGATFCGFVNAAGEPREEDIAAVDEATSVFVSALSQPMRNAVLSAEGLEAAGREAADALMESVLGEFNERGVTDPWSESPFVRVLSIYTSYEERPFSPDLRSLTNFLASLVWVYGDATTRTTLSGCGVLTLADAPAEVVHQEFPTGFPRAYCRGDSLQTLMCSMDFFLETFDPVSCCVNDTSVLVRQPLVNDRRIASWEVFPDVVLSPLEGTPRP